MRLTSPPPAQREGLGEGLQAQEARNNKIKTNNNKSKRIMKKPLAITALLLSAATLTARDIKTATFTTTPQMHCENCENKIKKGLRFERGIKRIDTSVEAQTVTIKYNADKTTPATLLEGFKKIGYEARQLKQGEKVKRNEGEECTNM